MKFTTIFNEEIDTPCAGCSVLGELMVKANNLRTDKENMVRVSQAIDDFREYFINI